MQKEIVLIAGGTGLIGQALQQKLLTLGYEVRILTRQKNKLNTEFYYWNPDTNELDVAALKNVSFLINLCGEGIADKRWSEKRKAELYDSRIKITQFLASFRYQMPNLKHYLSASGINCYGFGDTSSIHLESDPFGKDYISELVKQWESAADEFSDTCLVSKIRISMVLSKKGGALDKLIKPIRFGIVSPIGSGKQLMPWIHISDLTAIFAFCMEKKLEGAWNAVSACTSNYEFTKLLGRSLGKKRMFPAVPGFLIRLALGELSDLLLKSLHVSSAKLTEQGFQYSEPDLAALFSKMYAQERN